jgi:hypothetical protein
MTLFERIYYRVQNWRRFPQTNRFQKQILGQYTDVIDVDFMACRMAAEDTARYMLEHMRTVPNFNYDYELRDYVLDQIRPAELIMEFGVAEGHSIRQLASKNKNNYVYGFDTFEGLPEAWDGKFGLGAFSRNGNLPTVPNNVKLIKGLFSDSLPEFLEQHTNKISLIHMDCDLYSSTRDVLNACACRIRKGTWIIFDEYNNYPGWQQDSFRAWQEFVSANGITYEYRARVGRHQQVAVEVTETLFERISK